MPPLIRAPVTPDHIRSKESFSSETSSYKNRNWYRRHVQGTMPPVEYHDNVEEAIRVAMLP